jgi:hypothetical protein
MVLCVIVGRSLSPILRSGLVLIVLLRRTENSAGPAMIFYVAAQVAQSLEVHNLSVFAFSFHFSPKKSYAPATCGCC